MAPNKLCVDSEIIRRFATYYELHPTWGSLHIVLDDGNYQDCSVDFCIRSATEDGDHEGRELAELLRKLSFTQRRKIADKATVFGC